jgi:hypothetical protein
MKHGREVSFHFGLMCSSRAAFAPFGDTDTIHILQKRVHFLSKNTTTSTKEGFFLEENNDPSIHKTPRVRTGTLRKMSAKDILLLRLCRTYVN